VENPTQKKKVIAKGNQDLVELPHQKNKFLVALLKGQVSK